MKIFSFQAHFIRVIKFKLPKGSRSLYASAVFLFAYFPRLNPFPCGSQVRVTARFARQDPFVCFADISPVRGISCLRRQRKTTHQTVSCFSFTLFYNSDSCSVPLCFHRRIAAVNCNTRDRSQCEMKGAFVGAVVGWCKRQCRSNR